MNIKTTLTAIAAATALTACGSLGGNSNGLMQVRNGPQTQSLHGGTASTAAPNGAIPVTIIETPETQNEFNQNSEIYSAGFQGALAVATAR